MTSVDYDGMTVNERLFTSGRLAEFERAISSHDAAAARAALHAVNLDTDNIEAVLRACLTRAAA